VSAPLFLIQRASAAFLALAVAAHLVTILYAIRGGLTAGEILARTHGNVVLLLFYSLFVIAVVVHAPIGLRNVAHEWLGWRGRTCDVALAVFGLLLLTFGLRAVVAVFVA
jgi:succinate dehydrogenase subunit C